MTIDPSDWRLIAFDLDDTLAESKSAIEPVMAQALARLLRWRLVGIISGGGFAQFDGQVLTRLPGDTNLANLHLLPTCGTRYLRHVDGEWVELYRQDLTADEKSRVIESLTRQAKRLGSWEPDEKLAGERFEDRGSQITYSALGQQARPADKRLWDVGGAKRHALAAAVAADVPDLQVAAGGSTSIDVTRRGVDKAYGMKQLSARTGVPLEEMVFIGDRLEPGGNDYPVVCLGVATVAVSNWADTLSLVNDICRRLEEH